jgi:hypothetical protein
MPESPAAAPEAFVRAWPPQARARPNERSVVPPIAREAALMVESVGAGQRPVHGSESEAFHRGRVGGEGADDAAGGNAKTRQPEPVLLDDLYRWRSP